MPSSKENGAPPPQTVSETTTKFLHGDQTTGLREENFYTVDHEC